MARITTVQENIQGPINRDENLIAHSWFVTLAVGAVIGAIALLFWTFQAGEWSERRWPTARAYAPAVRSRTVVRPRPATPAPSVVNIHVDAEVRVVSPVSPVAQQELTPEQKAEQFKEDLRHQYGVR